MPNQKTQLDIVWYECSAKQIHNVSLPSELPLVLSNNTGTAKPKGTGTS